MPIKKENVLKALNLLRQRSLKRNYTQSIQLIVVLDVDMKKPENRIAENIELPHTPPKPVKVCVIADGDLAIKAKEAGADLVLGREELDKFSANRKAAKDLASSYDFFIAEAPLMVHVGRVLGAVLGPRGKMPTPVSPTAEIASMIKAHRKMVRVRSRDQPQVQCRVGTEGMSDQEIAANVDAVISKLEGKLERGMGSIRKVLLKMDMGEPISVPL